MGGFTVLTNVASLRAQAFLRSHNLFLQKTVDRVTTGLRIVASGDDAAGLAVANQFRSDLAVLRQGIRNANDGLSTLQTIDGGINNIGKLLDRARTLAAQSASGTFEGDRTILDDEFQKVLEEIDRQAQAIGLDTGGKFAAKLQVFIGGGKTNGGISAVQNGSVTVDLSRAMVDTRNLGLKGFEAAGNDAVDLSSSQPTSVANILADPTNVSSAGDGFTDFYFYGPGFSGPNRIKVSVNVNGVGDIYDLVDAINAAIESAEGAGTAAATAFKNAKIRATVKVDSDGSVRLAFTSPSTAFQVRAGDRMANALLGNTTGPSSPTGADTAVTLTGSSTATSGTTLNTDKIVVRFQGGGLSAPVDITINVTSGVTTINQVLDTLTSEVTNNAALKAAGISVDTATPGSSLVFKHALGEAFEVLVAGDVENALGLGSFRLSSVSSGNFDYTSITATSAFSAPATDATGIFEFSIAGSPNVVSVTVATTNTSTAADVVQALNNAFLNDAVLRNAGLEASESGGVITINSNNGTYFRVNFYDGGGTDAPTYGFETYGAAYSAPVLSSLPAGTTIFSGGVDTVEATSNTALDFEPIRNATDDQTINIVVSDVNGREKTLAIVLQNDSTGRTGATLDEAINYINQKLQQTNDPDFQKIVAVKERINGSSEGIRFISSLSSFRVVLGTTPTGVGIHDGGTQGVVMNSEDTEGGVSLSISTKELAEVAVEKLAEAVTLLGKAQAKVGSGQNRLTFAVELAQSQIVNISAAESRIRDADLAEEAANLTKAQILIQAGMAALAQANATPQQVLALLR